jgi:hypothetical protein
MHFNQSGEFRHWFCQQAPVGDFKPGSIVGDEAREGETPVLGSL